MSKLRVQEIEILGPAGKAGVPIGHPYIQLPGMPEPSEIYTGTWENVSDQYPGDFFRVEGGEALAFDPVNLTEQLDQMQRIIGTSGQCLGGGGASATVYGAGAIRVGPPSSAGWTSTGSSRVLRTLTFDSALDEGARVSPTSSGETRARNRTIRIWKRIA